VAASEVVDEETEFSRSLHVAAEVEEMLTVE
jgi:hypothetical protein